MDRESKILQDITDVLKENGITVDANDITVSSTMPKVVFETDNTVCFEKKLVIEVVHRYSKKKILEDGWLKLS